MKRWVLAAALALAVAAVPALAAVSAPKNGKLAFSSKRSGAWEIWTANADGKGARRITSHGAESYSPSWSPDGRSIAYSTDARCQECSDVWIVRADGTGRRMLGRGGLSPVWSRVGNKIAYTLPVRSDPNAEPRMVVARASGGGEKEIGEGIFSDWSPNAQRIVYMVQVVPTDVTNYAITLYVADADGTNARAIATEGYPHSPSWSPDGNWIVYSNRDGLRLVRPDGSGDRTLLAGRLAESTGWSPDGNWIVFTGGGPSAYVWRVQPDGTGLKRLFRGIDADWAHAG